MPAEVKRANTASAPPRARSGLTRVCFRVSPLHDFLSARRWGLNKLGARALARRAAFRRAANAFMAHCQFACRSEN
jgi:hypothetical protein